MITQSRARNSAYMEWAKLHSTARFNLAASGVMNVPGAELPIPPEPLEITGSDKYGYEPLQKRIAAYAGVDTDCIVAAIGASLANHLVIAGLVSPGDGIVIERPVYGPLLDVAEYVGARITRVARSFENDFDINLAHLESAITSDTRLVVLSNLHNPSGALLSTEMLRAIGEMAMRVGARVLVDEVYVEMLFQDRPPSAFCIGQELSRDNNPFVVTNSLTKAYGLSGLRCGWIVASPELARRLWRFNDLFGVNAPHAAEQLSAVAFDHLAQFERRARALLTVNRALLDDFLNSRSDLDCFRPPGGSVVFPRLRNGDPETFLQILRDKYETTVVPGKFFDMPRHFRIGIGGESEILREGLVRLGAALDAIL